MIVMQAEPTPPDDTLIALARNTRHLLDDLIGYVDVIPPKLPLANIRTLVDTSKFLATIDTPTREA